VWCSNLGSKGALALLVHGDAAFAGLGVVSESFQMAALPAYSIGGSLHIVINNHIGFTTLPEEGRSSESCTDIAMAAGVPVIHANADNAEALVRALREALAWREEWGKDVVVNVCGYRCGHHASGQGSSSECAKVHSHSPPTFDRIIATCSLVHSCAAFMIKKVAVPMSKYPYMSRICWERGID
jgi:2-oxoglutarate dehydrogenase complex dehydrogenase (E1) component-like enzyme